MKANEMNDKIDPRGLQELSAEELEEVSGGGVREIVAAATLAAMTVTGGTVNAFGMAGAMAEKGGEACEGRRLHLEVTDVHAVIFERLDLLVLVWVLDVCTKDAPLWTIESSARDGVTANHIVACNLVNKFFICYGYIRCTLDGIPLHVFTEGSFQINVADHVTTSIIV